MRKIGLDVGDKTVGIAVSDPLGFTAQGIMTLERVGIRKDTTKILEMVKRISVRHHSNRTSKKAGRYRQHTDRKGI